MSDEWSDRELEAAVKSYAFMLEREKASEHYDKTQQYRQLVVEFERTDKAFEYRMKNISYVLQVMGR